MYNYNKLFGKIRTPDEWKNDLYGRIGSGGKISAGKPAVSVKRIVSAAAAAAAVFALSVTAAAATGIIDLGRFMKNDMNDIVSYEKLSDDDYQPLDAAAENDKVEVRAAAFLGDRLDSFLILEARLKKDPPEGFLRLGLDTRIFGEGANGNNYMKTRYYGVPQKDENGDDVYIFRVRVPSFWAETSADSGIELTAQITGVCFERALESGEKIAPSFSSDMRLCFAADGSVLKDITEIALDNYISSADCDFTLRELKVSEYCERLSFDFVIPDDPSELFDDDYLKNIILKGNNWTAGEFCGRKILRSRLRDGKFLPEECPIKLIADGEYIPYLGNDLKVSENAYFYDSEHSEFNRESGFPVSFYGDINDDSKFHIVLCFEPFDFDAAKSVAVEIETSAGNFETIRIK